MANLKLHMVKSLRFLNLHFLICILYFSILGLFITGCAVYSGVYHTVEKGQTLWRISKAYNADIQEVAELNDIIDQTQIKVGQKIFIPGASEVLKVEPYKPTGNGNENSEGKPDEGREVRHTEEPEGNIVVEKWRFSWPVKGTLYSPFGVRNGKKHDGIDIAASEGSPVYAAADGEVMYSDDGIRGYGNIVMLKHTDGFITVYAHNAENLVRVGDAVKRGDMIAKLGSTGNASGPHLHFEVRKDKKPRNPLFFLP